MPQDNSRNSRQTSHRGKIAIFIDGNNLFHAARSVGVEIDYAKLLEVLRGEDTLLRAFFYTGVDQQAERQQGFLLWMRRNGYRVVEKELKMFSDGTKKANLDVEIAVDMLSLADKYDTAILVSGDEDFSYAVNAVAYKGVRVEVAGFRSNTSPRLIDVADRFIELDALVSEISKSERYTTGGLHRRSESHSDRSMSGSLRGEWGDRNTGSFGPPPRFDWHSDRNSGSLPSRPDWPAERSVGAEQSSSGEWDTDLQGKTEPLVAPPPPTENS